MPLSGRPPVNLFRRESNGIMNLRVIMPLVAAMALWAGLGAGRAGAQEWAPLSQVIQTFSINGQETRAVFHPFLKTTPHKDRLKAQVRVRGDLNDFRRVAPSVVLWRQPIEMFNTALVLQGRDLRPDPPGVVARGLLLLAGTEERTGVEARLVPEIVDNSVRLRAQPMGRMEDGLLKTALQVLGMGEAGTNPLVYLLNKSFSQEDAGLNFPPELRRFDPVFRSAAFSDPGRGGLALDLLAELRLKPEELPYLIDFLAHLGE